MTTKNTRVDDDGGAYAGSQLQIQIYVNRQSEGLTREVFERLPDLALLHPRLNWVSPLEKDRFSEYQDTAFLKACGLEHLSDELKAFWPRRGPVWDALASIEFQKDKNNKGILLVEAKSYPAEIYGSGCKASPTSREKIEAALNRTKKWCGVSSDTDWTGSLYQSANRMAHRKKLEREKDKLVKQQVELQTFDEKLRHYADQRISLDLDDGVKVNYGKFGDLLAEVKAITGKKKKQ